MPAPEEMVNVNPEDIPNQPTREITQTDHLNKKLLTSLLNSMNEGGNATLEKMLEPDNTEEENDEWKD